MNNSKLTIEIKNYKSLVNIKLHLHKNSSRLIAIIGENNVGKTSFLNAINQLSINPQFPAESKTKYLKNGEKNSEFPSIKLQFLFENEDNFEEYIETSIIDQKFKSFEFLNETKTKAKKRHTTLMKSLEKTSYKSNGAFLMPDVFTNEYRWKSFRAAVQETNDQKAIDLINKIKKLNTEIKSMEEKKLNVRFFKESLNLFKFTELDLNLIYDAQDLEGEQLEQKQILKTWQGILPIDFKEFLEESAKKNNSKEARERKNFVKEFEEKINKFIAKISNDVKDKSSYKFKLEINEGKLFITLAPQIQEWENETKVVWNEDPKDAGDGVKWLYSLILRLHVAKKNEFTIFLLDEPEKHLNIIYQNLLLNFFKLFLKSKDRINQAIIFATHSPSMIDMSLYNNLYSLERSQSNNATELRNIYDVKGKKVPNGLLDKNIELMFLETQLQATKPSQIIFVEGISDFNVFSNITKKKSSILIIPLFGSVYAQTAAFHIPYLQSFTNNYKLIVDDDSIGKEIINWFNLNTNIKPENIKKISDFFPGKDDLEKAIIDPWFVMNKNYRKVVRDDGKDDKKLNSLIFNEHNQQDYLQVLDFIEKK